MKQAQKSTAFLLFIILLGLLFMALVNQGAEVTQKPTFAEFLSAVEDGRVDPEDLVITAGENEVDEIAGRFSDLVAPVNGTVEVTKGEDTRSLDVTITPEDGAAPIVWTVSKKIYGARLARWRPTSADSPGAGCAGGASANSSGAVTTGDLIARGPKFQTRGRTTLYVAALDEGNLVPDYKEGGGGWGGALWQWLPVVIILLFLVFADITFLINLVCLVERIFRIVFLIFNHFGVGFRIVTVEKQHGWGFIADIIHGDTVNLQPGKPSGLPFALT